MDIVLIDPDPARRAAWASRLARLGGHATSAGTPADAAGAALLLLRAPESGAVGALLTLAAESPAVFAVIAGSATAALREACALAGVELLEDGADDAALALLIRHAARLQGERSRRLHLETEKRQLAEQRLALRDLAPFEAGNTMLRPATGRYRAQHLLAAGPALVITLALDGLGALRAGAGADAAGAAEARIGALLAEAPARLGDMMHVRGPGAGWALWRPGHDREAAERLALGLLDRVEGAGLPHGHGRRRLTLSAGIALAPAASPALSAEERADAALARAADLGGNRIRWAD
ncbi:hypothetical protein [Zavarzinia sp.]|uniref:hypothetical protein n=1 Tax=Zavarzinia sp. TaxID=2027920 RepID=UPI003567890C